jgi:hypothetical protein
VQQLRGRRQRCEREGDVAEHDQVRHGHHGRVCVALPLQLVLD